MQTFEELAVRRPLLAQGYLALLGAQPGRPLALFAPRRVGKTFFLDHDLAPAAQAAGMLTVYADLWLYKAAPLDAINHALEEALDDVRVPTSAIGKAARTPVRKVGALGVSLELGDAPDRRALPDNAALRLDVLVTRLARQHQGRVLLMLDEVQALGEAPDGVALIGALRAVLHKRREEVCAVFTGSSQEGLARLMTSVGAPMYQFAQIVDFPFLDDEFLQLLAAHFSQVHPGKALALDALRQGFGRMGFKPALMRDVVKAMSAEGITDVPRGIENYMTSGPQVAVWLALLNSLEAFDQAVLLAIASAMAPFARDTLKALASVPGAAPTVGKVRSSIEKLKRAGLLSRTAQGTVIDDPLFAEFLLSQRAGKVLPWSGQ